MTAGVGLRSVLATIEPKVAEYEEIVAGEDAVTRAETIRRLVTNHGWTMQGAHTIEWLAHEHGAFVLGNALALAIALEIEDGASGL